MKLNRTHDAGARCWLASANAAGCDFPVQNLPFAMLRPAGSQQAFRAGVAVGDQVIDLAALAHKPPAGWSALAQQALSACAGPLLNDFMAMGQQAWSALRHALFDALRADAPTSAAETLRRCLLPLAGVEYALPARIGNYTDFYTSIHHARNVGRVVRPDDPLTPNFQWLPIAYHGRASSVVVSGTPFHRPRGQTRAPGATAPAYGPCARLDYELEIGFYIGPGNAMGQPIPLDRAEQHVFGLCLLNDWSARDHQFWEMAPLGPFLGKNFCTSVSPWIVTLEALAPYRLPFDRPAGEPQPLPYLDGAGNRAEGALDLELEVLLETRALRERGASAQRLSATNFRHQYWTIAQMVAQHTNGGCNLQSGDLCGTGTISGPTPSEAGAMIELSRGGSQPIDIGGGERRTFLEDGDAVILRGWCERPGRARIGFGECRGEVLPSVGN
jgi:fumarylacetoacetase